jgi:hypothetical protein
MWTRREAVSVAIMALSTSWTNGGARAQAGSAAATLCPTGKLRAVLIASNLVLVTRSPDGTLGGVSVAVARAIFRVARFSTFATISTQSGFAPPSPVPD